MLIPFIKGNGLVDKYIHNWDDNQFAIDFTIAPLAQRAALFQDIG